MNKHNIFNPDNLSLIGIAFETEEETEAFADILQEELEIRIGTAISKKLTEKQLKEFEQISDPYMTTIWLSGNCPGYRSFVQNTIKEFKEELVRYREQIPGICLTPGLSNTVLLK